jgi:hypothetical protein
VRPADEHGWYGRSVGFRCISFNGASFAIAAGGQARARPWSLIGGFYREVRQSLGALEAPEAQKLLTGDAEFGYEEGIFMGDNVVDQIFRDLIKLGIVK